MNEFLSDCIVEMDEREYAKIAKIHSSFFAVFDESNYYFWNKKNQQCRRKIKLEIDPRQNFLADRLLQKINRMKEPIVIIPWYLNTISPMIDGTKNGLQKSQYQIGKDFLNVRENYCFWDPSTNCLFSVWIIKKDDKMSNIFIYWEDVNEGKIVQESSFQGFSFSNTKDGKNAEKLFWSRYHSVSLSSSDRTEGFNLSNCHKTDGWAFPLSPSSQSNPVLADLYLSTEMINQTVNDDLLQSKGNGNINDKNKNNHTKKEKIIEEKTKKRKNRSIDSIMMDQELHFLAKKTLFSTSLESFRSYRLQNKEFPFHCVVDGSPQNYRFYREFFFSNFDVFYIDTHLHIVKDIGLKKHLSYQFNSDEWSWNILAFAESNQKLSGNSLLSRENLSFSSFNHSIDCCNHLQDRVICIFLQIKQQNHDESKRNRDTECEDYLNLFHLLVFYDLSRNQWIDASIVFESKEKKRAFSNIQWKKSPIIYYHPDFHQDILFHPSNMQSSSWGIFNQDLVFLTSGISFIRVHQIHLQISQHGSQYKSNFHYQPVIQWTVPYSIIPKKHLDILSYSVAGIYVAISTDTVQYLRLSHQDQKNVIVSFFNKALSSYTTFISMSSSMVACFTPSRDKIAFLDLHTGQLDHKHSIYYSPCSKTNSLSKHSSIQFYKSENEIIFYFRLEGDTFCFLCL